MGRLSWAGRSWTGRPINFSCDGPGPRPGPAHEIFKYAGPDHDMGGEAHETRALYGLAYHFCGPARGFDGAGHGPAHVLSRTKR